MPKTNYSGATAFGLSGIVENAYGERSELDPSKNLDGTTVDGFESDERDDIEKPNDDEREMNEARPAFRGEPEVREDQQALPGGEDVSQDEKANEAPANTEEREEPKQPAAPASRRSRAAK